MNHLRKTFHFALDHSIACAILAAVFVVAITLVGLPLLLLWVIAEIWKAPMTDEVPYQMTLLHQREQEAQQQEKLEDEAQEYAQFKEWLTQYDPSVEFTPPEMVRLFPVWRWYTPEVPAEGLSVEEEQE